MDEQLPYNGHDDLPLPNEEESWQKMKALLEKKEKRRRWLPFLFWRYAVGGLLLIGLATGGYFSFHENKTKPSEIASTESTKEVREKKSAKIDKSNTKTDVPSISNHRDFSAKEDELYKEAEQSLTTTTDAEKTEKSKTKRRADQSSRIERKTQDLVSIPTRKINADKQPPSFREKQTSRQKISGSDLSTKKQPRSNADQKSTKTKPDTGIVSLPSASVMVTPNKTDSIQQQFIKAAKDSSNTKGSVQNAVAPPIASAATKKQKAKKSNRFQFSAGIGLGQAITFNGQTSFYRDSTGKKRGFFEHMPSVYLRMQKGLWFLQGEFWYRVPQPVKSFSFSQTTSYDSASAMLNTNQTYIQKLYYHQALFSVNRFLKRNWSWGVGGTYNLLAGALVEREVASKDAMTGNETRTKSLATVKGYTDSFLYRSTAGILLQTDYHYKRITVGLRYTRNLQPFIKYTTPDGAVLDEKNGLLQAVVRLRLTQSR